jgi:hypothetical protein
LISIKEDAVAVASERPERPLDPRPDLDRALAFLDPLLAGCRGGCRRPRCALPAAPAGDDEADARTKLARVPFNLRHHSSGFFQLCAYGKVLKTELRRILADAEPS